MSRHGQSGKSSKLDKCNTKNAVVGPPAFLLHDFIPNRCNRSDWISLTRDEDDSSFIGDLIDKIVTNVLDQCEEAHMGKQLMPFTLTHTKNVLLQLIEWYFIAHDVGEPNEKDWQGDKEPHPTLIDSWAQGSVPVFVYPHYPSIPITRETSSTKSEKELVTCDAVHSDTPCLKKVTSYFPKVLSKNSSKCKKPEKCLTISSSQTRSVRSGQDENAPFSGKVSQRDQVVLPPVKSVKSTKSRGKDSSGVVYDADGYIVELKKIEAKNLPDYQVGVSYRLVSVEYESPKKRKEELTMINKLNRRAPTKPKTARTKKSILLRQLTEKYSTPAMPVEDKADRCYCPQSMAEEVEEEESQTKLDPHMPTMIETVDAAPGVTVREGNAVKKGPSESQQMLIGSSKERSARRRYLTVNVHDTAQLRLLPTKPHHAHPRHRHSVLPPIPTKRNIEAS